jgi:Tol biopolymer transport system component
MPTRRQLLGGSAASVGGRVVLAAGAAAALTSCTVPVAVAPRRHAFLYRTLNGYRRDLMVCDAAGRNVVDIVHGVFGRAAWTPDGRHLAVSRGAADDSLGTWALWVVVSNGALLHRITNPPGGVADLDPCFAPDGQTIAFSRDTVGFGFGQGIWLVRANGAGLHFVPGAAGGITPSFSSNGQAIVYAARDGIRRIPTVGGASTRIVAASFAWQLTQPTWSPNGRRVAFVRHNGGTATSLCIVGATGGSVTALTSIANGIECPAWSRDSATLTYAAFAGVGAEGRTSTTVFRQAVGGRPAQVFHPAGPPATDLATLAG